MVSCERLFLMDSELSENREYGISGKMLHPLDGLRVVEVGIWGQGPLAAAMLGDMGAEVIKVEMPRTGDPSRLAPSVGGRSLVLADGRKVNFEILNRNKKGITLDLHSDKGKEVLYQLVAKSDIFVTNLSLGAIRQFGIDAKTIKRKNNKIIYALASGFGPRGPDAEAPCQDTSGMARSGFMFNSPPADGSPVYAQGLISDVQSATCLTFGIVTALLVRERMGTAQTVIASQLSAMMWLQYYRVGLYANAGYDFMPFDKRHGQYPLFNLYKCRDEKWIALGMIQTGQFWADFCEVAGIQHLEKAPKFENEKKWSVVNAEELIAMLDDVFATRPRAEWEKLFREKGFWFSMINRIADLPEDPQVIANRYVIELENGIKTVSFPFEIEGMEIPNKKGAPKLGQHTEEILGDVCGYSRKDIHELKDQGVI